MISDWTDEQIRECADHFTTSFRESAFAMEVLNLRAQVRALQASSSGQGQDALESAEASTSDFKGPHVDCESEVRRADDGSLDLVWIKRGAVSFCLERIGAMDWHLSVSDGDELVSMAFNSAKFASLTDVDFAFRATERDIYDDAWEHWCGEGEE